MRRTAGSSQAAWALLTEGVTSAQIEAHRLTHLVSRAMKLVEASEAKEQIYETAGDVIQAVPHRLENLIRELDRTAYALSVLGGEHLRDRLPMADRKMVDEATEKSTILFGPMQGRMARRVALRWERRQADLVPPLGWPGGPCHVIERIRGEVPNPKLREDLIDDVELGEDLSNPAAAKVYEIEAERMPEGASKYKRLLIGPHAQYRMDLRGVNVPIVRAALKSFFKAYGDAKSRKSPEARRWEEDFARSSAIVWTDPRAHLTIVFAVQGEDVKLVSTYWQGESDPRPPGDGGCDA